MFNCVENTDQPASICVHREYAVRSVPDAVHDLAERIICGLREDLALSDRFVFQLRLALDEALANALKHGNSFDPSKVVMARVKVDDEAVSLTVVDEGPGFDPGSVPDPRAEENLQRPGGRGVLLMESSVDRVIRNASGNSVTLIKRLDG